MNSRALVNRGRDFFSRASILLCGIASAAVLSSCSLLPMPVPTPTPTPTPSGDGILAIGDMTPLSGPLAGTSAAQAAGIELAVREINEQGGVLGSPVEVWHRDAGEGDPSRTESNFADLVARGVDVIIAPASDEVMDVLRPLAAQAGVLVVAPATKSTVVAGGQTAPIAPDDTFAARLRASDPTLSELSFGGEAYDLTVALALSATFVGDDGAPSLSWALSHVQGPGIPCSSYGACLSVLSTEPLIAYRGIAGPMQYNVDTSTVTFGEVKTPTPTKSAQK